MTETHRFRSSWSAPAYQGVGGDHTANPGLGSVYKVHLVDGARIPSGLLGKVGIDCFGPVSAPLGVG